MFIFKNYGYDALEKTAWFEYGFDDKDYVFRETMRFENVLQSYDKEALQRALFLSFLVVGTSYFKTFPVHEVRFEKGAIDTWQAHFLDKVYQEGLSQFAFENNLTRDGLAHFVATTTDTVSPLSYNGEGVIALQSGGKDSLLVACLLEKKHQDYTPWYVSNGPAYPKLLDDLTPNLSLAHRAIDRASLAQAANEHALSGHVPVTYIVLSYAIIQAVLLAKNTVIAAIAHEGDEPHGWIGDLPVNHQWSKTWQAEQLFAEYVQRYISPNIRVGSPLRDRTELKVAELFSREAWPRFGEKFSSCNVANYAQGADNSTLQWCGNCPKCANAYLLFAPFIDKQVLDARLGGELFAKPGLTETFKGLLGIDGVMKPFECVGETDELRSAYHLALGRGYGSLPFEVPRATFAIDQRYPAQEWAVKMLQ